MLGAKPASEMIYTDNLAGLSRLTQSVNARQANLPLLAQQTACLAELADDVADEAQLLALSLELARKRTGDGDQRLTRMAERVQTLVTSAGAVVASANAMLVRLREPLPGSAQTLASEVSDDFAEPLRELAGKAREVSRLMVETLDVVSWVPSGSLADDLVGKERTGFCPSEVERHLYRSATSLADFARDMQDQLEAVEADGG